MIKHLYVHIAIKQAHTLENGHSLDYFYEIIPHQEVLVQIIDRFQRILDAWYSQLAGNTTGIESDHFLYRVTVQQKNISCFVGIMYVIEFQVA